MNKRTFFLICIVLQIFAILVIVHYRNRLPSVAVSLPSIFKTIENQTSVPTEKLEPSEIEPRQHQSKKDKKAIKVLEPHRCGYEACYPTDPKSLNVHVVAHSHDDVGWLKTVDEYYFGRRQEIQKASVQAIINSVIQALENNPKRKFIQVESAYLAMWWDEHKEEDHARLRKLINNGQMEIIGGAWSMNDEACTHYQSIIDQFTFGLRFLDDKLGECARPKIGWQIDPFGHSREMASIFAQLGYDGYLLARTDHRDQATRLKTQTAEMLWQGSANLGKDSWIFTHVLYNHYQAPLGFYFDILSHDEPLVSDQFSSRYNLPEKIEKFTEFVSKQATNYNTNNIILTMGMDFAYQNATYNYENLDTLIKAYEDNEEKDAQGRRIKLFYSTPSCYVKAVNEYATKNELGYAVKTDDFMPYSDKQDRYWTGYYTSRPTLKKLERQGNNLLQIAKQLATFYGPMTEDLTNNLDKLKSAMGIMQHHDAITGTEKQEVAKDYTKVLTQAIDDIHTNITEMLRKMFAKTPKDEDALDFNFQTCLLANVSRCEPAQHETFVVAVYNPLSYPVTHHVRIPVNSGDYYISGPEGSVRWQIVPAMDAFSYVEHTDPGRFELVFDAPNIPPLGAKLYYISDEGYYEEPPSDVTPDTDATRLMLGDTNLGFTINAITGFLENVTIDGQTIPISQQLMFYRSGYGSGAYAFKPGYEAKAEALVKDNVTRFAIYKGDVVDEVHQTLGNWTKQIIRVYNAEEKHIEFDWLVGPIDISDGNPKEVISRFVTNLNSSNEFFTDSNAREILKRRVDFRASYPLEVDQPISGNYYPINSGISIADKFEDLEVAVISDRPQGGTSLRSGELELMVHRRLLHDDGLGVDEALNETEFKGRGTVARGQHYLTFGSADDGSTKRRLRDISRQKQVSPWVFISQTLDGLDQIEDKVNFKFSGLSRALPNTQVQILTLEPWKSNKTQQVLLRVEHTVEVSEGGTETVIDLKNFFNEFQVISLQETTLAGNQLLSQNDRLVWKASKCLESLEKCESNRLPDKSFKNKLEDKQALSDLQVFLTPMEIRTFIMTVSYL